MTHLASPALPLLALMLGAGCASVPKGGPSMPGDGFSAVRDQPHYQVRVRPGEAGWPASPVFRMPEASVTEGAHEEDVSVAQAALVATHAARSVCLELAPWVRWADIDTAGRIALQVRRIAASSSGLALVDSVLPGPLRLPVGLGALEIATRVEDAAGVPVLDLQWARGANPLLHRSRASSIGDAWELAPSHARDLLSVLDRRGSPAQSDAIRTSNIAACESHFGRVSAAGRAASMIVPLSPEAIDPSDDVPPPLPTPAPKP